MRLWSLHPQYLDSKGLVALWREGLLAQNVLLGNTKGYKHHPQLIRFQECADPIAAIGSYLFYVQQEATRRKYNFDLSKIKRPDFVQQIAVSDKQLEFELAHLKRKLEQRDLQKLLEINSVIIPEPHPLFVVIQGDIATWERP
jgi:hypothetical protein